MPAAVTDASDTHEVVQAPPSNENQGPRAASPRSRAWLLLAALVVATACWEVVAEIAIENSSVSNADWRAAGALVRDAFEAGDAISAAPRWADPMMRMAVQPVLHARDEGRSDLFGYKRLWVMSIRGERAEDEPTGSAEFTHTIGGVTVRRYRLPAMNVFDLTAQIREASAQISTNALPHPCAWRRFPPQRGGGLDQGPFAPVERFGCDLRPWLWVGPTTIEDLDLRPRYCIWQHPPPDGGSTTVSFPNVPAGQFSFHGGLHWVQERWRRGAPVQVSITQNGNEIAHMTHRDGDGWARIEGRVPSAGELTISVSAPEGDHERTFCWDAKIRSTP